VHASGSAFAHAQRRNGICACVLFAHLRVLGVCALPRAGRGGPQTWACSSGPASPAEPRSPPYCAANEAKAKKRQELPPTIQRRRFDLKFSCCRLESSTRIRRAGDGKTATDTFGIDRWSNRSIQQNANRARSEYQSAHMQGGATQGPANGLRETCMRPHPRGCCTGPAALSRCGPPVRAHACARA
jgi:hypothetical protein